MPRSGIRRVFDLAAGDPAVIHLEMGEPNFPTPPPVVAAAEQALEAGYTKYSANAGLLSLREALVDKLARENGIAATPDEIVVTAGGMNALASAFFAVVCPGDEVLVPAPWWPNWAMQIRLAGGVPVHYPLRPEYSFQPQEEDLASALTARTRCILINSPSNPSGAVLSQTSLEMLLAFAVQHDLMVVSDEVYEKILFTGRHYSAAQIDQSDRVLSVFSFSKTFAMTGWRVGYLVASPAITEQVIKLQELLVACAPVASQRAAEAALALDASVVSAMVDVYRRRAARTAALFAEAGITAYPPAGTFYMLVDISCQPRDSLCFASEFLAAERVAVAPGSAFGPTGERYVRISLATEDALLDEGCRRLARFINQSRR